MMKKCLFAAAFIAALYGGICSALVPAQWATASATAAGSVTASYTTLLTNTYPLQLIDVLSTMDCTVILSFDGTTNHIYIPPGSAFTIEIGRVNMMMGQNVSGKYTGSACTSGSIYISGAY